MFYYVLLLLLTLLLLIGNYYALNLLVLNFTQHIKNFEKIKECRDELVKNVWGQGRAVSKNDHMSNIHKPHPHTYPYMWCIICIELH